MSTPTWPAGLPVPRRSGHDEQLGTNTIRSQMDTGPAKVRRRFTKRIDSFTADFAMTSTQLETLLYFFSTTCADGSLSFAWEHPRTGAAATCRFIAPPDFKPYGMRWIVSVRLEVLP